MSVEKANPNASLSFRTAAIVGIILGIISLLVNANLIKLPLGLKSSTIITIAFFLFGIGYLMLLIGYSNGKEWAVKPKKNAKMQKILFAITIILIFLGNISHLQGDWVGAIISIIFIFLIYYGFKR